ncbi:UDP-3-O-(3-hydroxymyristoyl)glucosamine N-acyltransferase [Leptolyngbya sp. NIES-2104]|uniref:UDP-3-O-(3-hydroxymyristoyl)glucosamine N-acyltransferase n=1 Tax=Leptolyngbya sp. NIES-2104 TaxID=1552121 RepID=UPI0006ECB445|nr:UDP-3-O-(3-hydroxymyristoyl)glucosamine N-acyltransferase [Leptolyngbya sp. NIES-2104]GAP97235.1 UDP-3-O-[3-hydroxymyristoyl] glucosamine N-acyltransferase [Leptolyngbya sp. NIES-2104]
MRFQDLVEKLGISVTSSSDTPELEITGVSAIADATPNTLTYAESTKYIEQLKATQASAVILPANETLQGIAIDRGLAWIVVSQPRLVFASAIALFYQPYKPAPRIHPTAVIDPSAQIGESVSIGAHVVIESGVKVGNHVCIHPNVVVYPDVVIGDRTVLHANCTIQERSQIGADCVIHSGAVIGSEGFGFVPTREGWLKMEQAGYTVLEDGVEIGCNSAVDRPAVGETRIGRNTKLDNFVQIGHGVKVGEACAFAAQVGIAGGSTIGNRVILAGQVGVGNEAKMGDGSIASARTGVHSDVKSGVTVSGYPAVEHRTFLRAWALYTRLPEMYQAIKQIQKRLDES